MARAAWAKIGDRLYDAPPAPAGLFGAMFVVVADDPPPVPADAVPRWALNVLNQAGLPTRAESAQAGAIVPAMSKPRISKPRMSKPRMSNPGTTASRRLAVDRARDSGGIPADVSHVAIQRL